MSKEFIEAWSKVRKEIILHNQEEDVHELDYRRIDELVHMKYSEYLQKVFSAKVSETLAACAIEGAMVEIVKDTTALVPKYKIKWNSCQVILEDNQFNDDDYTCATIKFVAKKG